MLQTFKVSSHVNPTLTPSKPSKVMGILTKKANHACQVSYRRPNPDSTNHCWMTLGFLFSPIKCWRLWVISQNPLSRQDCFSKASTNSIIYMLKSPQCYGLASMWCECVGESTVVKSTVESCHYPWSQHQNDLAKSVDSWITSWEKTAFSF